MGRGMATTVFVLLFATGAVAQEVSAPSDERSSYALAQPGIVLTGHHKPTVGVEFGQDLTKITQVYLCANWMQDVAPNSFQQALNEFGNAYEQVTGTPTKLTGRIRAFTLTSGVKVILPVPRVRPYLRVGLGYVRFHWLVRDELTGQTTDDLVAADVLPQQTVIRNTWLAEAGGGVAITTKDAWIDVGYRYRYPADAFASLRISELYAGIGIRY